MREGALTSLGTSWLSSLGTMASGAAAWGWRGSRAASRRQQEEPPEEEEEEAVEGEGGEGCRGRLILMFLPPLVSS